MSSKLDIIVDARALCDPNPAGVARYIEEIVNALLKHDVRITLISNRKILIKNFPSVSNLIFKEFTYLSWIPGTFFIMLIMPIMSNLRGKIFWGANHTIPLFGFKSIVTIHDVVAIKHATSMTFVNRVLVLLSTIISIIFAKSITTVSEFTRKEIYSVFKFLLKNKNITVIRNSVNREIFYQKKIISKDELIPFKFILGVGSIEPRKNLHALVESFFKLKSDGYCGYLILIGGRSWKANKLQTLINSSIYSEFIIFKGFVDNLTLNNYYNQCDIFVFPSFYEGFGIPPLEATIAGANIVCSINTEMPYIFTEPNNKIIWYDPSSQDLTNAIKKSLIHKESKNNVLVTYNYSWIDSAAKLFYLANCLDG